MSRCGKKPRPKEMGAADMANLPVPAGLPDIRGAVSALEFLLGCADAVVLAEVRKRIAADPEKLALMIVRALNPVESLSNDEEGTLRGLNRHTVGKLKAQRAIPQEPQ